MSDKGHLSAEDLVRLRRMLVAKRDELHAEMEASRGAQRQPSDELENGDRAEQSIERDAAERTMSRDAKLFSDVVRAIAKIDGGAYGFSEVSGEPISLHRLEAVPWARRTHHEEEALQRRPS